MGPGVLLRQLSDAVSLCKAVAAACRMLQSVEGQLQGISVASRLSAATYLRPLVTASGRDQSLAKLPCLLLPSVIPEKLSDPPWSLPLCP